MRTVPERVEAEEIRGGDGMSNFVFAMWLLVAMMCGATVGVTALCLIQFNKGGRE